ncbi:MAG: hypothetical protein U0Z26_11700 [Anaerolineales bacterium]
MNKLSKSYIVAFLVLMILTTLACSFGSISPFDTSTWPTLEPMPADFGTPTGSSPMSGDWSATTDFGKISFTIDPEGKTLVHIYVSMQSWTCGGDTLTTGLLARTEPPPTLENGSFGIVVNLGDAGHHNNELTVIGTYDEANDKFSGEWQQDAYGTTCTGTWETASR